MSLGLMLSEIVVPFQDVVKSPGALDPVMVLLVGPLVFPGLKVLEAELTGRSRHALDGEASGDA